MDSDNNYEMGRMSPPREEANSPTGSGRSLSPELTSEPPLRGQRSDQEPTHTSVPLLGPSHYGEVEHGQRELAGQRNIEGIGSVRQIVEQPTDKHLRDMTFVELDNLLSYLPHDSKHRQQAFAEIKLRPQFLKYGKISGFAIDNGPCSDDRPLSQQSGQFAQNLSTTPLGPPPIIVDGLSWYLMPPQLPPNIHLASYIDLNRSSSNGSPHHVSLGIKPLAKAERLIQEALSYWDVYKSANHAPWQSPMNNPWEIPSPPEAQNPTSYVVPPNYDANVPGDHTAFLAEQAWLSADNLPPAMGYLDCLAEQRRSNRHVTRSHLQQFTTVELPSCVSRQVEGWRLAYWLRRDRDLTIRDVIDRFYWPPGKPAMDKQELQQWRNTLSMRHQRWSYEMGGFMFPKMGNGEKVSLKQLEIVERALQMNGFEGLERNMIWDLEKATGKMVQPQSKHRPNSQGHRFTAPERSFLKPRVEAAFQTYIWVVKAAKSRGLVDWRKIDKSVWQGETRVDVQAMDQSVSKDRQYKMDEDVQFLHKQPLASTITRSQIAPSAHPGDFSKNNNATQQFAPLRNSVISLETAKPAMAPNGLPHTYQGVRPHQRMPLPTFTIPSGLSQQPMFSQTLPNSQQLSVSQHPQFVQQQIGVQQLSKMAAHQQRNGPRAQRFDPSDPLPENTPSKPVSSMSPPSTFVLTPRPISTMRPVARTVSGAATSAAIPKTTLGSFQMQVEIEDIELKQFDAKQIQDKNEFIADQKRTYSQFTSQDVSGGARGALLNELYAYFGQLFDQFTAAQRRNRDDFTRAQGVQKRALQSLRRNGTPRNPFSHVANKGTAVRTHLQTVRPIPTSNIIDLTLSPTHTSSMPIITHTPPSPPAALQAKRPRASFVPIARPSSIENKGQMEQIIEDQALNKDQVMEESPTSPPMLLLHGVDFDNYARMIAQELVARQYKAHMQQGGNSIAIVDTTFAIRSPQIADTTQSNQLPGTARAPEPTMRKLEIDDYYDDDDDNDENEDEDMGGSV